MSLTAVDGAEARVDPRAQAVWADAMLAAALLAVDPGLGGAVVRAGAGPARDAWLSVLRRLTPDGSPWRRLPPGIDDGRLLGGLDMAAALGAGRAVLQRGLLAEADGGVLVAPMAERLSAATAARLAAAVEDGAITVERDGFAAQLQSRVVLVALDEGVGADEQPPAALTDRLAFHFDLDGVGARDVLPIAATAADISEARAALARVGPADEPAVAALCAAAEALGVDSLRAPWLALRAANALAALEGRDAVDRDDLSTAARLVLTPRATRAPAPAESQEAADDSRQEPSPADGGGERQREEGADTLEGGPSLTDVVLEAATAALPHELALMWALNRKADRSSPVRQPGAGARQAGATRGRRIGVRAGKPASASALDIVETLKAAAPWRKLRGGAPGTPLPIRRDDLRVRRYEQRAETTVIFVVDASGSAALQRLGEAKGAVELLLAEAYARRTQVALIAFRGAAAELLLPPTRSLTRARRSLAELAGGGATPLAAAIEAGGVLAQAERAKGRTPLLVLLTDGRGNIALDGAPFRTRAETDALAAARRVAAAGFSSALIDTSPRPRGEGARLAEAMGARFAPLPYVEAGAVRQVVRALDADRLR